MKKGELVGIAIALVLIIILATLFIRRSERVDELESALKEKDSKIEYFINNEGKLIADKQAAEVSAATMAHAYPEIIKALKNDLDIKVKDLKAYVKSEIKATGSGTGSITHNHFNANGEPIPTLEISDGYLEMTATPIDSLNAYYEYSYSDTIQVAISTKKKWLLGKESLFTSATLSNPNAKVINSKGILVKDYKDKRFGLGVGVLYDPFINQVRIGVGIQYNFLKF